LGREELIKQLKKDLSILEKRKDILAVLLFGSRLFPEYVTNRSDIDICVVAPNVKNHFDLQLELYRLVRNDKYDIKVFELLPLYLKIEIIKNHEIIFARNKLDLYEYFYFYRKLWKDQEYRNTFTKEDHKRWIQKMREKLHQLNLGKE